MRKLQNIVSNFGNVIVRQGNQLVTIVESLRSLRASSSSALYSYASRLATWLGDDAWQGPAKPWTHEPRIGTGTCFTAAITALKNVAVVKQDQRRHLIMCHRAAA